MKIQKEPIEGSILTLGDLNQGELFEKDCNNPAATYMVVKADNSRNFSCEVIAGTDQHMIVVDLGLAIVKAMPKKMAVTPLETHEGLTVREVS